MESMPMTMETGALLSSVAHELRVPEDELPRQGLRAYVERELRAVKVEIFQICGRCGISEETEVFGTIGRCRPTLCVSVEGTRDIQPRGSCGDLVIRNPLGLRVEMSPDRGRKV